MKRLWMCLLAVCLLAIGFAVDAPDAKAAQEGHYTYLIADGKATITKYDGTSDKMVEIPAVLGGCPVVSIGENAFYNCDSLSSVTIPNSVTSIGNYAFYSCSWLQSITIPNSVTSIGERAFEWCISLKSITIPDGVTSIGQYAFKTCNNLSTVSFGSGVERVGFEAFDGCKSLNTVRVPSLADWLEINFSAPKSNPLFYADNLVAGDARVDDLIIPDGVTQIKPYAFYKYGFGKYSSLGRMFVVYIPDSVITIGHHAFHIGDNPDKEDGDMNDYVNVNIAAHLMYGGSSGDYYSIIVNGNNAPLMDKTPHYGGVAKTDTGDTVIYCQQCDVHLNLRTGKTVSCVYTGTCDDACDACGAARAGGGHKYTDWYANDDGHWKECTGCGEVVDFTGHNPGPGATATSGQHCTVCNYQLAPPRATQAPTQAPTAVPTQAPTAAPTQAPTAAPTRAPATATTAEPTVPTTAAPAPQPQSGTDSSMMIVIALIVVMVMFGATAMVVLVKKRKDSEQ